MKRRVLLSSLFLAASWFTGLTGLCRTSNTLCWCLLLLFRSPDKLKWLREEVDGIQGKCANYDEALQLKRTNAVFYEALRMYPTVMSYPRECHEDYRLKSGWDIPKGSLVFVSQHPMNHDTKVWGPDALEFKPERFINVGELQMSKPVGVPDGERYGFAPFGGGPRTFVLLGVDVPYLVYIYIYICVCVCKS